MAGDKTGIQPIPFVGIPQNFPDQSHSIAMLSEEKYLQCSER